MAFMRLAALSGLIFLGLLNSAYADTMSCERLAPQKRVSSKYKWTEQDLAAALMRAQKQVEDFLTLRSKDLQESFMYGPNLDGTYFYRLGIKNPTEDIFALGKELNPARRELIKMGFPTEEPEELLLANLINNRARAIGAPQSRRCAKNFPGGTSELELTEALPVHYVGACYIQRSPIW